MRLLTISLLFLLSGFGAALAADPDERLEDPLLEARAQEVGAALRCVVCKSQSIEASDAPLAKDLRILVRERIAAGDSNDDVLAFVSARYGDYVLLKPPVQPNTWALWAAPALMLGGAALFGVLVLRRKAGETAAPVAPLTPEEEAALTARTDDAAS